jgi:protein-disulfide isomerase
MPDSVWNTLTSRPRLLPLPTPMHHSPDSKKEATLAYKSYDELKDIPTSPIHRPSYKPCSDPSAAAKKIDQDLKDIIPEEIKKSIVAERLSQTCGIPTMFEPLCYVKIVASGDASMPGLWPQKIMLHG